MMESKCVPAELLALRDRIDDIDDELVALLARRFQATGEVGRLKAEHRLDSVDPAREQDKLKRLGALAEQHQLEPDFVVELFRMIFREVVKNHRRLSADSGHQA